MEKLIVLGTGNAMATRCYNTCFALQNGAGTLLVDAGGGSGILAQLQKAGLAAAQIHELIVTHAHCDHILGVVWIVRAAGEQMLAGRMEGTLTIHCRPAVEEAIRAMCGFTLQKKVTDLLGTRIRFDPVAEGSTAVIAGQTCRFFSILSTKMEQYGFVRTLENGGRLTCLGDEPCNPACEALAQGADWLLSEAFCLYADRDRFRPYEKHHSTVADAAALGTRVGAKNLVLWHTEDSDLARRRARYTAEARQHFAGGIYVPDDLDVIPLG
jgi:ribonuclease Z